MKATKISHLFGIKYPIVQAGMVWCSGWRLAVAVSNAGGLGLLGAGSMHPDTLLEHIKKAKAATQKPFGVNIPLLYPEIGKLMETVINENIKIIFSSAGNPKTWTPLLKSHGITVVHVVSSVAFALKAQEAGVDAVVAEGFEAGGHNGREETTTLCLVPQVVSALKIPVIAAGGIASGAAMAAMFALGAQGVQIGSLFAVAEESSAHENFKKKVIEAKEGDTVLTLKKLAPVRMLKNTFYEQIAEAESQGADVETLRNLLGKGRSKKGIFEGDLEQGELEIGQVSAQIKAIKPAAQIVNELVNEYTAALKRLCDT